jgi:hypothetical protein
MWIRHTFTTAYYTPNFIFLAFEKPRRGNTMGTGGKMQKRRGGLPYKKQK